MKKFVKDVLAGFEDAIAHAKGDKGRGVSTVFTIPAIDVKSIRKKTGLTQEEFSQLFAIKARTLQDWEQKRRTPGTSARVFLTLIDQSPSTVKRTLKALGHSTGPSSVKKTIKHKSVKTIKSSKKIGDPKSLKHRLRKQA